MVDLLASRVRGTARQLFGNVDCEFDSDEFFIRPTKTRTQAKLANLMGDLPSFSLLCINDLIARISTTYSAEDFRNQFIIPQLPVLIDHCTDAAVWPAGPHWNPVSLVSILGKDRRVEVKDANATVSLGDFVDYMDAQADLSLHQADDNPAYIWETLVDGTHDDIISKFTVPQYFTCGGVGGIHDPRDSFDLLSCAGENGSLFGLHRWMLIGPSRSGSNVHVDPLGTSAWNTLLLGSKLWVAFPPGVTEEMLKLASATHAVNIHTVCPLESGLFPTSDTDTVFNHSSLIGTSSIDMELDFCAASWFTHVLPRIQAQVLCGTWPMTLQPRVFVQHEGETLYIPAGWPHAVLNLSDTVCVTQNFAEVCNYSRVAREIYNESAIDSCDADEWRLKVIERARGDSLSHLIMTLHCVHCSEYADGNICELLEDRPVCIQCQATRPAEYTLVTLREAEECHNITLWRLSEDDLPPYVMRGPGRGTKHYLLQHLRLLHPVTKSFVPVTTNHNNISKSKSDIKKDEKHGKKTISVDRKSSRKSRR